MTNIVRYRLTYGLTLDEQVEDLMLAWKALGTLATQRKLAVMMGVMMALLLYVLWRDVDRGGVAAFSAGGIAGVIFFATVNPRMRRAGRTILRKINGSDTPIEIVVELTDSEVIVRRPEEETTSRWPRILSVTEDSETIRLLTRRYATVDLPKRAFRSTREAEECVAFIRQKLSLNGVVQA